MLLLVLRKSREDSPEVGGRQVEAILDYGHYCGLVRIVFQVDRDLVVEADLVADLLGGLLVEEAHVGTDVLGLVRVAEVGRTYEDKPAVTARGTDRVRLADGEPVLVSSHVVERELAHVGRVCH